MDCGTDDESRVNAITYQEGLWTLVVLQMGPYFRIQGSKESKEELENLKTMTGDDKNLSQSSGPKSWEETLSNFRLDKYKVDSV